MCLRGVCTDVSPVYRFSCCNYIYSLQVVQLLLCPVPVVCDMCICYLYISVYVCIKANMIHLPQRSYWNGHDYIAHVLYVPMSPAFVKSVRNHV